MEIMDGKPPSVDGMDKENEFSKDFKTFINKCLIKDPQKRQSAEELLKLKFFSKYSKDRQFMIQHFVKHIKKIQIKQCNDLDLPSSVLEARKKENKEKEEENATKKGKFTVTKIKEEKPKQSKFKVTSVNESGDKSEIKSADAPKTKSRFKVTTVHDK